MNDFFDNIDWENTIELWHLAVLLGVLFIGIYWEYRKIKPRSEARIIALSIAFISLYIIYLSPYTLTEKPSKSVMLINQSVSEEVSDSLRSAYDVPLLRQQIDFRFKEVGKEEPITLDQLNYQIDTAFVYGYFDHLSPEHYQFRKDIEVQKGIQIYFQKSITLGDSLLIDIQNMETRDIEISAIIGQDSISKSISNKGFSKLATLPKVSGNVLCEIASGNQKYYFSVRVEEVEKYVVQILAATPDFEWKFLGDYLKSKEHSVHQKTQISKGKFKSSFFNWYDSLEFNRGVAKDLKVLFTDAKAWEDLGSSIQNRYLSQLKENRGSLIIRTNPNSEIELDLDKSKSTNIFSTSSNLLESKSYNYLQFSNIYRLDEVAENSVFRKVNPELIYGVINFQNSFQLKLSGKNQEYDRIWNVVFNNLVRNSTDLFYDKSKWVVQHQPFFFRLWSDEKVEEISIANLHNDTIKLKSKRDFIYPERQHFMFYPNEIGWHFINVQTNSETIPFYIHSEDQADQLEFLSNYQHDYLNYLNFDFPTRQQEKKYNQDSVTLWFFLLFLLSIGYLWIEDKIT